MVMEGIDFWLFLSRDRDFQRDRVGQRRAGRKTSLICGTLFSLFQFSMNHTARILQMLMVHFIVH